MATSTIKSNRIMIVTKPLSQKTLTATASGVGATTLDISTESISNVIPSGYKAIGAYPVSSGNNAAVMYHCELVNNGTSVDTRLKTNINTTDTITCSPVVAIICIPV